MNTSMNDDAFAKQRGIAHLSTLKRQKDKKADFTKNFVFAGLFTVLTATLLTIVYQQSIMVKKEAVHVSYTQIEPQITKNDIKELIDSTKASKSELASYQSKIADLEKKVSQKPEVIVKYMQVQQPKHKAVKVKHVANAKPLKQPLITHVYETSCKEGFVKIEHDYCYNKKTDELSQAK